MCLLPPLRQKVGESSLSFGLTPPPRELSVPTFHPSTKVKMNHTSTPPLTRVPRILSCERHPCSLALPLPPSGQLAYKKSLPHRLRFNLKTPGLYATENKANFKLHNQHLIYISTCYTTTLQHAPTLRLICHVDHEELSSIDPLI